MIVVFGGTGFIGSHVVNELIERGEVVLATQRTPRPVPVVLESNAHGQALSFETVDVTSDAEVTALFDRVRPTGVIDLSGYPPKKLPPAQEVRARVAALTNILEAARVYEVSRITLTSSMDAYWGLTPDCLPYQEDQPVPLQEDDDNFITQAWAKKTLEVISSMFRRQAEMDIRTVRLSGIYGPGYRSFLNLPSRLAVAAALDEQPYFGESVEGIPEATAGYEHTYAKDAAQGIALVHLAAAPPHHVYNIGTGHPTSNGEIALAAAKAVPGFELELPNTEGESTTVNIHMDIGRAQRELGYAPRYSIDDGMREYIEWLRHHAA